MESRRREQLARHFLLQPGSPRPATCWAKQGPPMLAGEMDVDLAPQRDVCLDKGHSDIVGAHGWGR